MSKSYVHSAAISPDGREVAFVSAGDIYRVSAEGGEAELVTSHPGYDDRPRYSPDGGAIGFTSGRTGNGDVYIVSLKDGDIRRLTYHDTADLMEGFSPDGRFVYFTANRDCLSHATFRIPAEGGCPVCLFADPYEAHYNVAPSPDGKWIALNNNGDPWWRRGPNPNAASDIWVASACVGADDFRKLTDGKGRNLYPMWAADSQGFYYVSDRDGDQNIRYLPLEGSGSWPVTRFAGGRLLRPQISRDGRWIVFERDFVLWRLSVESGEAEPIPIRVRADQKFYSSVHYVSNGDLREFSLAPDGKKIAYVVRGKVFADFADKEEKPRNFAFKVCDTPFRQSHIAWSPDSKRLVYLSDRSGENQLFLYEFATRQETLLTDSPDPKGQAAFSPDGQWLAFFQRPDEIRLFHLATREMKAFIRANFFMEVDGPSFAWSPDSRWVAFAAQDERWFSNLYVQCVDEEAACPVTFLSNIGAGGVLWTPNGKSLLFTTGHYRMEAQIARVDLAPVPPAFREADFEKLFEETAPAREKEEEPKAPEAVPRENPPAIAARLASQAEETPEPPKESPEKSEKKESKPEPVKIVREGLKDRLRFLTPATWNAWAMAVSPDSKTLIFSGSPTGAGQLYSLSLEEEKQNEPPVLLTTTVGRKWGAAFTPTGKRLYYVEEGKVLYRDFPKGDPKTLDTRGEYDVRFDEEKRQMFREAWNLIRDHFYDPQFHGCDWNAVWERFRPIADGIRTSEELYELMNLMVGELNASHLGAGGGGGESADGYLGLVFDRSILAESGRLKVAGVMPNGPCAVVPDPVRVGEYLVAVDGQPVNGAGLDRLLHRTPGRRVSLAFAESPDSGESRQVAACPVGRGAMDHLTYRRWVKDNAAYVEKTSEGRLGYVHIRSMSYECYQQFLVDLDTEAHSKEGVVIDVRFNGGGHIAPFILDVLQRRQWDTSIYRGRAATSSTHLAGNRILDKPTIVITNEHSGSNTEMFSEGYRRLGLGKVVGKPTAGAVIWTWGWQMLDGSSFRLPRLQVATLEGENLEGQARPVDVEADRPLGEAARGQDGQLDTAVRTLLEEIEGIG
ncbi:MAG: PD40 domain-containing protein [Armatimonadetes bacterium]|nr:PD40 domain-containing protein [Armatimonadota bacterium]